MLRVQAASAGELGLAQLPVRPDQKGMDRHDVAAFRRRGLSDPERGSSRRGSKVDTLASSENSSRSRGVSRGGTITATSAMRSPRAPRRVGHALAAQAQPPPGGGPGRHGHLHLAARGGHRHRRAERGLPRAHRQLDDDVSADQPVALVREDPDDQVEVARRAATQAAAALAAQPDALPVDHARRDRHGVGARAGGARQRHLPSATPVGLLDGQREFGLLVGAAHRRAAPAPAEEPAQQVLDVDPGPAAGRAAAEVGVPGVPEVGEPALPEPGVPTADPGPGHPVLPVLRNPPEVVAEAVVAAACLRIRQHVVGLVDLLEPVLGRRVPVHVRVVGPGLPPVGGLDLLRAGVATDPEHVVVVARHG